MVVTYFKVRFGIEIFRVIAERKPDSFHLDGVLAHAVFDDLFT